MKFCLRGLIPLGMGFRVQGSGFWVQGLGLKVLARCTYVYIDTYTHK